MKAKLNIHLLSTLPRVLRMTHNEVADASGISIAHWYRLAKKPDKITVQQLIDLSNGLCVPVSRFFSFGRTDVVGVREDYILQTDYQKCYYDSEAVHSRIGRGTATSWREAADAVGMHWTNVAPSLLAVSRTPVTRLLDLCEAFGFDLFDFLVDPNRDPKRKDRRQNTAGPGGNDLREEIRTMAGRIDGLNRAVADITARYDDLLQRHTALLQRHNSLERTVRDFLGTEGVLRAADEPDGEP